MSHDDPTLADGDAPMERRELLSTHQDDSRYELTRLQGLGGTGRVWVAKDLALDRDVALKELIAPDRERASARFLREARITSRLEHPAIVPIYELGFDEENDRPFYTMRLVNGKTLREEVIDYHSSGRRPVDLGRLIRHFVDVCNAISYAHSERVVHRDLKTSNVVIGQFGETVVLDWGIAKKLDSNDPDDSVTEVDPDDCGVTIEGKSIGTPAYMPPEQAAGQMERIDERSDVYGLGAILYEILTGRPPFSGDTATEIVGKVIKQKPMPAGRIAKGVPRALEAICRQCMEKAPEDRFPSVDALHADIQNYLADQPVTVYRAPWTERVSRWLRKHKVAASVAVVLMLCSVVALTIANVILNGERARTAQERDRANEHAQVAEEQRKAAIEQHQRAHAAVERYLRSVQQSDFMQDPNLRPLQEQLLADALEYYQDFLEEENSTPAVMKDLAESCLMVANLNVSLGRTGAADRVLQRGRDFYSRLIAIGKEPTDCRKGLAELAAVSAKVASLEADYEEAAKQYSSAMTTFVRLSESNPDQLDLDIEVANILARRASVLIELGDRDGALGDLETSLNKSQGFLAERPEDSAARRAAARALTARGQILGLEGKSQVAQESLGEAAKLYQQLAEEQPEDIVLRDHLASALSGIGRNVGLEKSIEFFAEAIRLRQGIVDEHPELPEYRHRLGHIWNLMANNYRTLGRLSKALEANASARRIYSELATRYPHVPDYQDGLASIHNQAGIVHFSKREHELALEDFNEGLQIAMELSDRFPESVDYRGRVAQAHFNLGLAHRQLDQLELCVENYQLSIRHSLELHKLHPQRHKTIQLIARAYNNSGNAQRILGQADEAIEAFESGIEFYRKYTEFPFAKASDYTSLGNAQRNTGALYWSSDRPKEAIPFFRAAIESYQQSLEMKDDVQVQTFLRQGQQYLRDSEAKAGI